MRPSPGDLVTQLATLTETVAGLASRLSDAARELQASGVFPDASLVDELEAARRQFVDLRTRVLDTARSLSIATGAKVDSLRTVEPVVRAIADAVAGEERRAAAAAVFDRVLAITHVDEPRLPGLVQCQALAKALRESAVDPEDPSAEDAESVREALSAFAALLKLIEDRERLADEQFATMEDIVNRSFGRALAVAATRGKLAIAQGVAPAPLSPPTPVLRLEESARPAAAMPPTEPSAVDAVEQVVHDEESQWWVSAWARWTSWKGTLSFQDAAKKELAKHSYLLSVPIRTSTDYEEGLLAYGYSILLDYVERQHPGFVTRALDSLKTFAPGPGTSLGTHLYDCLVREGRVAELYPEFVSTVFVAAVPEPGVWTQARILESNLETRVFTRPSGRLGDPEHNSQRLTQDKQRFTDHRFQVALPPLTTRFFAVAADLKEPRSIAVKVTEGRAGSDQAWLLTMPPKGRADRKPELIRLAQEGTAVPGLGKDYATLWIAVFNADPGVEKRYELIVSLKKEVGQPAATFASTRA